MTLVYSDALERVDDMGGIAPGRLVTATIGGTAYAVISADLAYGNTGGVVIAKLLPNGALEVTDSGGWFNNELDGYAFWSQGLTVLEKGDSAYVYMMGPSQVSNTFSRAQSITVLEIDADGKASVIQNFEQFGATSSGVSQNGVDPEILKVGNKTFLVQPSSYGDEINTFEIKGDGTLDPADTIDLQNSASQAMDTIQIGNASLVVVVGPYQTEPIRVLKLNKQGELNQVYAVDAGEPLLFNRVIVDIKLETVGDKTFAFVAESTGGTILVYELKASGQMTLVGYEAPGIGDRWGYPYSIETFESDGQTYLVTGGNDDAMAVFAVSREGALTEVDEWQFEQGALRLVNELAVIETGGRDFVVASSPLDNTVRSWRYDEVDDAIRGDSTRNRIEGTEEDDRIFGFGRADKIFGREGDDLIEGGAGADTLNGGAGADDLYGGAHDDVLRGNDGADWLFGGDGNDRLEAGKLNDRADGGAGNDTVLGGSGNDWIKGSIGRDRLFGGSGNDTVSDGFGADIMHGGTQADVFVFSDDGKIDRVRDFEDGIDLLDLRAEGDGLIFPDLTITQQGDAVRIAYGNDTIVLEAKSGTLSVSDIGLDDFILA
ncbi:MAG: calcium-binding protein [Pseudomonadota bacterium]